ncbi:hypothetical protein K0M31_003079 [Melipona bicolor]|uniref:Uncharacterized protein n=1 Tax=Melipona bicolor TaxID=60889 RepID=A0AA40G083_9HYME|nr:hypothetical protein K0M31_003079 [Melipona bicolor]
MAEKKGEERKEKKRERERKEKGWRKGRKIVQERRWDGERAECWEEKERKKKKKKERDIRSEVPVSCLLQGSQRHEAKGTPPAMWKERNGGRFRQLSH